VRELFSAILRRPAQGRSPFSPDHVLVENGLSRRAKLFVMRLQVISRGLSDN
jgi:hypothetical protein